MRFQFDRVARAFPCGPNVASSIVHAVGVFTLLADGRRPLAKVCETLLNCRPAEALLSICASSGFLTPCRLHELDQAACSDLYIAPLPRGLHEVWRVSRVFAGGHS
jgi:hypothetical protein